MKPGRVGQDDVLLALMMVAAGYSPATARRVVDRVAHDFVNRPYADLISEESLQAFQDVLEEEGARDN